MFAHCLVRYIEYCHFSHCSSNLPPSQPSCQGMDTCINLNNEVPMELHTLYPVHWTAILPSTSGKACRELPWVKIISTKYETQVSLDLSTWKIFGYQWVDDIHACTSFLLQENNNNNNNYYCYYLNYHKTVILMYFPRNHLLRRSTCLTLVFLLGLVR